jgi:hypothetical protein
MALLKERFEKENIKMSWIFFPWQDALIGINLNT